VWFFSITVAGLCVLGCRPSGNAPAAKPTLRVLCGSSMAAPIQEIGQQFSRRHGLALEYDLGGSETLLPKILMGVPADIYVCHDPFEDKVKEEKHWSGSVVVGYLEPIVAVRPGNPKGIRVLEDLQRPGLKLGIGDPRYSTCGALFFEALERQGLRELVMPQVMLQGRTHAEIANGLILGPLDAVVVWNFVAKLYQGKLEVVPTDVAYPETRVTVVGLKQSANPAARDEFLQWCAQPEAQQTFRTFGYTRGTGPSAGTQ
jgi:molybdate transport system substrate-binding protein